TGDVQSSPAIATSGRGGGLGCRALDITLGVLIAAVPLTYSVLAPASLKWALLGLLAPVAAFLWLWGGCGRPFLPLPRLAAPLFTLLLVSGLSLLQALNLYYGVQRIAFLLFLFLLYLTVAYAFHPDRQETLIRYLLLTLLVVSGVSLFGCTIGLPLTLGGPIEMIYRLFGNTNYAAAYLLTVIPLGMAFYLASSRSWEKAVYGTTLFLSTAFLIHSMVRGAWVSVWIGLWILVRVFFPPERRSGTFWSAPLRSQIAPLVLLGSACLLAVALWPVCLPDHISFGERVVSTFDPGSDSLQLRWAFWEGTVRLIRDHIWTGVGVGNFALAFVPYRSPFIYRNPGVQVEHPHNEYLNLWAELGPLGLLACLWLVIRVVRLGLHLAGRPHVRREVLAGVLGGLAAAAAYGNFFYIAHVPESAVNVAILLGMLDGMDRDAGQVERTRPVRLTTVVPGLLIAGLVYFQYVLRPLAGEVHYFLAQDELRDGRMEASLSRLERSLAWNPHYYLAHYKRAQIFSLMGRYHEAIRETEEILRIHPKSEIAYWAIGSAYLRMGEMSKAKEMFLQATAINPNFPHALNNLGILAAQEGRIAEAEALFLRAKETLGRKDAKPYINLGSLYEAAGRRKEALEMYEAAVAIQPNSGTLWYSVARLRVLAGGRNGAHAALARAIELDRDLGARAANDPAFAALRSR
ncbi:MAG: O-antigen ligase family protein, partial [candidate division NC10 bacterium]|nr:O-antigen ligase family protein [candidate division NC10 bacterium]